MLASHLPDRVVPAIVPTDPSLAIDDGPSSVGGAERLSRFSICVKSDEELASVAIADFPLASKVTTSRRHGAEPRILEFNAEDFTAGELLLMAILINDHRRSLKVDARDLGHRQALPVPVFEYDHQRIAIPSRGRDRFRKGPCYREQKNPSQRKHSDETAHKFLRNKRSRITQLHNN